MTGATLHEGDRPGQVRLGSFSPARHSRPRQSIVDALTSWRIALAGVVLCVALLGVFGIRHGYILTGDSPSLVRGARVALDCAHLGHWRNCGRTNAHASAVAAYPLLQYLPAAVMIKAGLSNHAVLQGLGALSYAAFVATVAMMILAGHRSRSPIWTPILVAIVLTGPLLLYATSAFGEMLSAAFVLGCILAVLHRRPVLVLALALIAGLGKETLPPFIVMLGLIVGRDDEDGWFPPASVLGPLVAGSVGAVALNGLFNQFRYATWGNANYLQPGFRISSVRAARNLWDLLAATNGGLIWFWTSMSLLLIGVAVVAAAGVLRRRPLHLLLPPLFVLATFGALMVLLAAWWSPFGWVAYGPRLTLPLLPALAVAAAVGCGEPLAEVVAAALRSRWALGLLVIVLSVSAWPQSGAPWQAAHVSELVLLPDAACPRLLPARSERYYDCIDHKAWSRRHNQLLEASTGGGVPASAERLAILLTVTALILEARRRQRSSEPSAGPTTVDVPPIDRPTARPTDRRPDSFSM